MIQIALSSTFVVMVRRKWMDSNKHSLSKGYSLAVFSGFILILIGNLWPILKRESMPFELFGMSDLEQVAQPIAIAIPLIFAFIIWALSFLLIGIVVPGHNSFMRGIRRARKRGTTHAKPWADDSGNIGFLGLFAFVALAGYALMYFVSANAGYFDFLEEKGVVNWQLPIVLGFVIFISVLLIQNLELKVTMLVILLQWFLPVLIAIISGASRGNVGYFESCLASISPIALLAMAGIGPVQHISNVEGLAQIQVLNSGVYFGLTILVLQSAWLCWRWRQKSQVMKNLGAIAVT